MNKKLPLTLFTVCTVLGASALAWMWTRQSVPVGDATLPATHENLPLAAKQPRSDDSPARLSTPAALAGQVAPTTTKQAQNAPASASPVTPDASNTATAAPMSTSTHPAPSAVALSANPADPVQRNSANDSVEVELSPGVQVPAVFLDDGEDMTPSQQEAAQNIADNFSREIGKAVAGATHAGANPAGPSLDNAWFSAKNRADEQYRALFGNDAYNRKSVEAGIEAVSSK
jgi:hypothetical protein